MLPGHYRFLFGEHRVNQTKSHLYEESVRIPLIIGHPDSPGQRSISKMVAMVNIAPTTLDIASARPHLAMDGRSLIPIMQNPSPSGRDFLLLEANHRETGNNIKYVAIRSTNEVYAEHLLTAARET
jgi:arylsulfatase A-like enzyme